MPLLFGKKEVLNKVLNDFFQVDFGCAFSTGQDAFKHVTVLSNEIS